mmetsp:Transcript_22952/g.38273  ORF Transcript_22952/g.38273 Transcript_22952/m.38273 type:complete len:269 (+) Transcript_22952:95-901(+)
MNSAKVYEKSQFQRKMISLLPHSRKELLSFVYGIIVASFITVLIFRWNQQLYGSIDQFNYSIDNEDDGIVVPMGRFPESAWRTPHTLAVKTVASTPFARFEIHKVRTESGAIINDWLWTDERSHVNILVHLKEEDKYLLFHQKKYGLDKAYYAAVGGLFNEEDTPEGCARRELLEETGLEPGELVNLGRYRVQVNRGGGILYAFFAKNSVPSKLRRKSDDYEKQEQRLLTRTELIDVALKGKIGEAQWLGTIALGLLYEEHIEHHTQQ